MIEWTIGADDAGGRLDAWLAQRPEVASRARARDWLARGKVFLNGHELVAGDGGAVLRADDVVGLWEDRPGSARRAAREVAAARADLRVVHEDRAVLVADKPPGMLVEPLPGDARAEVTLLDLVNDHLRAAPHVRALVVHRIDRDTSGLVLFAKTPAVQTALKRQFERRAPERVYLALVRGRVRPPSGTWTDRLAWDKARLVQTRAHPHDARGKEAVARYRVVEPFESATLLEVSLVTGKRNQIRVQAGLRGHPLVGERQYLFGAAPASPGAPALGRQALHAARLAFKHPTTGARVELTVPLPGDMARLIEELGGRSG